MQRGLSVFKDLVIGDRVFQIPIYQRNYSWGVKQWDDLWNDLLYLRADKKHFFGTVLLKTTGQRRESGLKRFEVYDIIDGQQRTATVLILLKEIMSQLESMGDGDVREELDRLSEDYLKYRDVHKLELLGDDREFFRRCIIEGVEYPDETLSPSQGQLKKAKQFFRGRITELERTLPAEDFKKSLLELKQKIDNMEIIRYDVENDADAVLIFETVNDRGKALSNLEKTKSFVMHAIYLCAPEDPAYRLSQVNGTFSEIFRWFEAITRTERGNTLMEDDIQRYHFIAYEPDAKQNRRAKSYQYMDFLRDKIRRLYRLDRDKCLAYALEYTEDLRKLFFALKEIATFQETEETAHLLERIFLLRRVATFFPLLCACWIRFREDQERLKNILRLIEAITFRVFAIGRRRADAGEGWLYDLAYKVHGEDYPYDRIIHDLKGFIGGYENDRALERDLRVDNFYDRVTRRDIMYLLFEYEKYLREVVGEPLEIRLEDVVTPKFEIEHIWAQNPSRLALPPELATIHEQYKDKLGNLTIASKPWNAKWGNEPFDTKREEYRNSVLRVQKELADLEGWGQEQIEDREKRLIEFTRKRWGFS